MQWSTGADCCACSVSAGIDVHHAPNPFWCCGCAMCACRCDCCGLGTADAAAVPQHICAGAQHRKPHIQLVSPCKTQVGCISGSQSSPLSMLCLIRRGKCASAQAVSQLSMQQEERPQQASAAARYQYLCVTSSCCRCRPNVICLASALFRYPGTNKGMLMTNTLFRVGGAAILLSNKRSESW